MKPLDPSPADMAREIRELVDASLQDELSEQQAERLESLICTHRDAGTIYTLAIYDSLNLRDWVTLRAAGSVPAGEPIHSSDIDLGYLATLVSREGHSKEDTTQLVPLGGPVQDSAASSQDGPYQRALVRFGRPLASLSTAFDFHNRPLISSLTVASLVMIAGLVVLGILQAPNTGPSSHGPYAPQTYSSALPARISRMLDCRWSDELSSLRVGSLLPAGKTIELFHGVAEITFGNGARVVVEGPATLIVESAGSMTLEEGRLLARVSQEALGFAVETPSVDIIDLGTEFGVAVQEEETEVHVFEGKVQTRPAGDNQDHVRILVAGQAAAFGSSPPLGYYVEEKKMNRAIYLSLATVMAMSAASPVSQASAAILQMKLVATDYDAGTGTWTDTSGMGNDGTQGTAGFRPTLVASQTPNGSSVVRFDGSDDFFNLPNFASGFTSGEAFLFVRIDTDPPGDAPQTGIWKFGTGTTSHYPFTDGIIYDAFGTTVRKTTGNPTTSLTGFNVYNVLSSPGLWESRINNVVHHTTGTNGVSFVTAPLLGSSSPNHFLDGEIAEFRFYSGTLTTTERTAVYNEFLAAYVNIVVPEPATGALLGIGGMMVLGFARRRRRRKTAVQ